MTEESANEVSLPGGRIGGRIAKLVADASVYSRTRTGGHLSRVGLQIATDFTNHVSDEVRSVMGPLFVEAASHPDTPDAARPLLRALGTGRGQAWAWIGGTATGAALGGGLINLLTNYLNPVVLPAIAASPHGILSPSDAAAAVARGLDDGFSANRDALSAGINAERFEALVQMSKVRPTLSELHALLNRGDVTGADAAEQLTHMGYPSGFVGDLLNLRHIDLSGEQLAAMWNRGIITEAQAIEEGRKVGYSDTEMRQLMSLGGDPPGPQELLLAWRRGIINEPAVDRALRQSPLRFEWIEVIKSLQWLTLPLGEAADAVNQGHMAIGEARRVARESGVRDKDFDIIVANAGLPPGPQETLDWVNRGLISEAEGLQALYESRIKNKWVPTYMRSRHETMPPETIRLMYSRGVLTEREALRRLQMRGYSADDAAILLAGASAEKTAPVRDLTQATIRDLYTERAITRDEALSFLTSTGLEESEALLYLELADLKRHLKFINATVGKIRSVFVGGRIPEEQAVGLLDALGMPSAQRDDLISLWLIEQATVTRELTPAQITSAVKNDIITIEEGMARLIGEGYHQSDAEILLKLAIPQLRG